MLWVGLTIGALLALQVRDLRFEYDFAELEGKALPSFAMHEEIDTILGLFEKENHTAWDLQPDGSYVRRKPAKGEPTRAAQQEFIRLAQSNS